MIFLLIHRINENIMENCVKMLEAFKQYYIFRYMDSS